MLLTAGVSIIFSLSALQLLYLLEDSLINSRLQAATTYVASSDSVRMPPSPEFEIFSAAEAPHDIRARLPSLTPGHPFETRLESGRYVHGVVIKGEKGKGERRVVIYDVTDQVVVSKNIGAVLLIFSCLSAAALSVTYLLARALVGNVTRHAERLSVDVDSSSGPAHLRELACEQEVMEFRIMLELQAKVWESQLQAIENERQALAYIGHEMRTPLLSAKTSLALLAEQLDGRPTFERLRRAVARIARASNAAIWLATERTPDLSTEVPALGLLRDLVQELRPGAEFAGQTIEIDVSNEVRFQAPLEIAEAILANLLLDTIQHGAPGRVGIYGRDDILTITNFTESEGGSAGFGQGVETAKKLGRVVGWNITVSRSEASVQTHIDLSLPAPKVLTSGSRV